MKLDSVGELLDGTETKFDGSPSPNGPGEICMRGRHLMMGYLHEEAKTREAIDEEGWLHSGDIGRVDDNDLLYITGRIKVSICFIRNKQILFIGLVWCPGQNKRIAPLSFFHECR
jgi:long-subunit acyl-CoA synthetase (AMP-forming)